MGKVEPTTNNQIDTMFANVFFFLAAGKALPVKKRGHMINDDPFLEYHNFTDLRQFNFPKPFSRKDLRLIAVVDYSEKEVIKKNSIPAQTHKHADEKGNTFSRRQNK